MYEHPPRHVIRKPGLALRPGTHYRTSLFGPAGGSLSIYTNADRRDLPGEHELYQRINLPVRIVVSTPAGETLFDDTTIFDARELGDPHVRFTKNELVDVTVVNVADHPIHLYLSLAIEDRAEVDETVVSEALVSRLLRGALSRLTPTVSIDRGKLRAEFDLEAQAAGATPQTWDLGFDIDANLVLAPTAGGFRPTTNTLAVYNQAGKLEAAIRAKTARLRSNPSNPPIDLVDVPSDFFEQVVRHHFSTRSISEGPSPSIVTLLRDDMGLHDSQWTEELDLHPILKLRGSKVGDRLDVAFTVSYRLTEIDATLSALELNADTITAELVVVLVNESRREPHPLEDELPDDWIWKAELRPEFGFSVDVDGLDTEVNLNFKGGLFTQPLEWLSEQVGEGVVELLVEGYLKRRAETDIPEKVLSFLYGMQEDITAYATEMMNELADRDAIFRGLRTDGWNWRLATLDPTELIPDDRRPLPGDRRLDDIMVTVPQEAPIDGDIPADASDRLRQVDHLVFLMMENRSFDHMLGYLSHPEFGARSDIDGLDGIPIDLGGDFSGTTAVPAATDERVFLPDPGHSVERIANQIANGAMNGFVSDFGQILDQSEQVNDHSSLNDPERVMQFLTGDQLPVYHSLAETDLVMNRWFSSTPAGTFPNRLCYFAGETPALTNSELFEDAGYLDAVTLFDFLDYLDIDWRCYESDISFLRMFRKYRTDQEKIRHISDFWASTDLPPVTIIEPNFVAIPSREYANDDHPPADVREGQAFIGQVLQKLQSLEDWPRTMLVITYDEHGGFADHVPPPGSPRSSHPPDDLAEPVIPLVHPDAASYGVRVPTFVVSEQVTPGRVENGIFDHTAVFRTVLERFAPELAQSQILPPRVRRSRHLGEVIEPAGDQSAATAKATRPTRLTDVDLPRQERWDAIPHSSDDAYRPKRNPPLDREDFKAFIRNLGTPGASDTYQAPQIPESPVPPRQTLWFGASDALLDKTRQLANIYEAQYPLLDSRLRVSPYRSIYELMCVDLHHVDIAFLDRPLTAEEMAPCLEKGLGLVETDHDLTAIGIEGRLITREHLIRSGSFNHFLNWLQVRINAHSP